MKSKKKTVIIVIAVILVLCIAGAFLYISSLDKALDPEAKDTKVFTIESGQTTYDIGNNLEKEGLIKSASKFKIYSKIKGVGSKFQAGTYAVSPAMKLSEITKMFVSGKVSTATITIPEGYTTVQIAKALDESGVVTYDEFMEEVRNGKFDFDFVPEPDGQDNRLEGYLYPDTYSVPMDADAHTIIEIMLETFDKKYKEEIAPLAKKKKMSMKEVVTVASLIERECQVDSEREKIASVIYNRLDKGMELQLCSTIQYLLGEPKEFLLYSDLEIDSPYNTYKNAGLPPGPIASPGIECLKAAVEPADTNYLYFVLDPKLDGSHRFSSDAEKFEKDKAAYSKAIS